MSEKARIIELQRQVRVARVALQAIAGGGSRPESCAEDALTAMLPLDKKQTLQGLCGHERRKS